MEDSNENIMIYADNREFHSKVVKKLALQDCVVKPKQLEVGDYLISNRVNIERKSTRDFVDSIFDQRLFRQLKEMKRNFEKPILIIEGVELYSLRDTHPNTIKGALASIAIDYRIPIMWSKDEEDTAGLVYWIAKREQIDERREVSVRGERKPLTLKEQQEFLVAGLPSVNTKIARRLLEEFGSPEKVFTTPEEKLKKVMRIGDKLAKNLSRVIRKKYEG